MFANLGESPPTQGRDVVVLDQHSSAVCLHQPDDVTEGHALAGAAASEQAEGLAVGNFERNIVEYLPRSEGLGHAIESHGAHPDTTG